MILLSEIKTPWWSLSIPEPYKVVEDIEDIRQCIDLILKTEKGADVLRPTFGSNIFKYIDDPINSANGKIKREVVVALGLFEKRIEVTQIISEKTEASEGKLKVTVSWKLISSDFINVQEIQF